MELELAEFVLIHSQKKLRHGEKKEHACPQVNTNTFKEPGIIIAFNTDRLNFFTLTFLTENLTLGTKN